MRAKYCRWARAWAGEGAGASHACRCPSRRCPAGCRAGTTPRSETLLAHRRCFGCQVLIDRVLASPLIRSRRIPPLEVASASSRRDAASSADNRLAGRTGGSYFDSGVSEVGKRPGSSVDHLGQGHRTCPRRTLQTLWSIGAGRSRRPGWPGVACRTLRSLQTCGARRTGRTCRARRPCCPRRPGGAGRARRANARGSRGPGRAGSTCCTCGPCHARGSLDANYALNPCRTRRTCCARRSGRTRCTRAVGTRHTGSPRRPRGASRTCGPGGTRGARGSSAHTRRTMHQLPRNTVNAQQLGACGRIGWQGWHQYLARTLNPQALGAHGVLDHEIAIGRQRDGDIGREGGRRMQSGARKQGEQQGGNGAMIVVHRFFRSGANCAGDAGPGHRAQTHQHQSIGVERGNAGRRCHHVQALHA